MYGLAVHPRYAGLRPNQSSLHLPSRPHSCCPSCAWGSTTRLRRRQAHRRPAWTTSTGNVTTLANNRANNQANNQTIATTSAFICASLTGRRAGKKAHMRPWRHGLKHAPVTLNVRGCMLPLVVRPASIPTPHSRGTRELSKGIGERKQQEGVRRTIWHKGRFPTSS